MKINLIYRSAPGDSKSEKRPDYFSKKDCLLSFLSAVQNLANTQIGDLIFLNDGDLNETIIGIMENQNGLIRNLGGVGNSASLRVAHEIATEREWNQEDLVYFAEDDYLYKKKAFKVLLNAAEDIPEAYYFTVYDHPDRYERNDDVRNGYSKIFVSRDVHWRTVESTCQSYGVRLKAFKKDKWIHKLGTSLNTPRGREMFRAVQGIGKYFWKFPKHPVISPMPSYATHMESKYMAKNVDWEEVSRQVQGIQLS